MAQLLQRRRKLTETETRFYMKQILSGVHYLHQNRILHRDLKLENLFLNEDLTVKIGNFGLSAKIEYDGQRKMSAAGTLECMAPEVLTKKGHSFEVDIWSIGCIMYALLFGKLPFKANTVEETLSKIKKCEYSTPTEISDVSRQMITMMLQSDPKSRPKADELIKHEFIVGGYCPNSLPKSALIMAPRFVNYELDNNLRKHQLEINTAKTDKMQEKEYKKLPAEEKCIHKLWKARVNGYEEVTKLFRQLEDKKSPEFRKYLALMKRFVVDRSAVAQEKGLEAALAYVENYADAGKTVSEVMSGIVAKCLAAPKTKTRELALQLTLMYIEIEEQEAVEEELIKGMELENPMIVTACINAYTEALREFGTKIISARPLLKKITVLLSDRNKTVEDETKLMVIELFRWIGGAIWNFIPHWRGSKLRTSQISVLEGEFAKIEGQKAVPTRYIRSQQIKQAKVAVQAAAAAGNGDDNVHSLCETFSEARGGPPLKHSTILGSPRDNDSDQMEKKDYCEKLQNDDNLQSETLKKEKLFKIVLPTKFRISIAQRALQDTDYDEEEEEDEDELYDYEEDEEEDEDKLYDYEEDEEEDEDELYDYEEDEEEDEDKLYDYEEDEEEDEDDEYEKERGMTLRSAKSKLLDSGNKNATNSNNSRNMNDTDTLSNSISGDCGEVIKPNCTRKFFLRKRSLKNNEKTKDSSSSSIEERNIDQQTIKTVTSPRKSNEISMKKRSTTTRTPGVDLEDQQDDLNMPENAVIQYDNQNSKITCEKPNKSKIIIVSDVLIHEKMEQISTVLEKITTNREEEDPLSNRNKCTKRRNSKSEDKVKDLEVSEPLQKGDKSTAIERILDNLQKSVLEAKIKILDILSDDL